MSASGSHRNICDSKKTKLTGDKITFGYCIAEEQLIFIEIRIISNRDEKVREYQDEERTSPLLLLFDWMEYLIKDDMLFLQDYEENLSHLEEELLEGNMEDFDRKSCYPERNFLC